MGFRLISPWNVVVYEGDGSRGLNHLRCHLWYHYILATQVLLTYFLDYQVERTLLSIVLRSSFQRHIAIRKVSQSNRFCDLPQDW